MAHVVGVPKREPCRLCKLPVFLAERLLVGEKVFHRTCLKCARCGSQLSPGSFYETEIDDQYCCETCPDEDVLEVQENEESSIGRTTNMVTNELLRSNSEGETLLSLPITRKTPRNSIRERLAFFEQTQKSPSVQRPLSRTKSLQKNVSDEEKCQLSGSRRFSYKMNSSLSNFLNSTLCKEGDVAVDGGNANLTNEKKSPKKSESFNLKTSNDAVAAEVNATANSKLSPRVEVKMHLVLEDVQRDSPHNCISNDELQNGSESPKIQENLAKSISSSVSDRSPVSARSTPNESQRKDIGVSQRKFSASLEVNITGTDAEGIPEQTMPLNLEQPSTSSANSKNSDAISADKEIMERLSNVRARLQEFESSDNLEDKQIVDQAVETDENDSDVKEVQEKSIDDKVRKNSKEITEEIIIKDVDKGKDTMDSPKALETTMQSQYRTPTHVKFADDTPKEINKNEGIPPSKESTAAATAAENTTVAKELKTEIVASHSILKNQKIYKRTIEEYPKDLDPFKSDDDDADNQIESNQQLNKVEEESRATKPTVKKASNRLNPFDSSDDEIELEKSSNSARSSVSSTPKIPPPRPPPPRLTPNRSNDGKRATEGSLTSQRFQRRSSLTASQGRRTPVPTPRSNKSQSTQNLTPGCSPTATSRFRSTVITVTAANAPNSTLSPAIAKRQESYQQKQKTSDRYGSNNYLYDTTSTYSLLSRNSDTRSSTNSLNSFADGTIRSRKSRRAPLPPTSVKELFPSNESIYTSSKTSTPSSSKVSTPKSGRKKRPAPAPPKSTTSKDNQTSSTAVKEDNGNETKNVLGYPQHSDFDSKLPDEAKVLLEGKTTSMPLEKTVVNGSKRIIHIDKNLIEDHVAFMQNSQRENSQCDDLKEYQKKQCSDASLQEEDNVVYRRVLVPFNLDSPLENTKSKEDSTPSCSGEYDLEMLKDNKEAKNRNRQSQLSSLSSAADDVHSLFNKSTYGKWKRRKGPAPSLPVPPRKILQMLPLQEIKHELEIIEVQQQGLEKQGVILENMIRERCEGQSNIDLTEVCSSVADTSLPVTPRENSKEVEYLILQLFELVNEKNELFRRQAELMYLRRQHRLEQEQADLEYEIRVLMAQPERNKTDSDKAREEALIEHLIAVVQQRNHVVDSLEMDRVREAEEDQSIKQRLESHIAKRTDNSDVGSKQQSTSNGKLSKKEKKKQKEVKKINKHRKIDVDKDADETEIVAEKTKIKKKKKLFLFR